ncbi:MAG: TetR/AcrR family transcriptional regulator [Methylococcaceae bacterium]
MKQRILASAQRLVQQRGFNGFSYADIAKEIGIRKASLHYYFPGKSDLGLALIETYSLMLEQEFSRINAKGITAEAKLSAYIDIYRQALAADCMCLGGMLASESSTLEMALLPGLRRFFQRNVEWLTLVLNEGEVQGLFFLLGTATDHARILVSALQGTLMIARLQGESQVFEQTAALLQSSLMRKG